jgi:hypothetical protein
MVSSDLRTRSGTPSLNLTTDRRRNACLSNLRGKKGKLPDDQILILSTDNLVHGQHSTLPTKPERNGECLLSAWPEQQVSYWWRHCSRAWELWKMLSHGEREIPHGKCNKDIRIGENFSWNKAVLCVTQWWDLCSECRWNLRIPKTGQFWTVELMSNFRIGTSVLDGQNFLGNKMR